MTDSVNPFLSGFVPGPVLLIGPPGVGKGTQAQALMSEYGIPQISTGDLLRDERARHTDIGIAADEYILAGNLVPDDVVNRMVAKRLSNPDCARGYVLDGFPRTLAQAYWLDNYLAESKSRYPVVVISLEVEVEDLLKRITGRRICPDKHIYNIYTQPAQMAGICDIDGKRLTQRTDDTEQVFEERMKVFEEETTPVIPHYRSQGRFAVVNGFQDVDSVARDIRERLQWLRKQSTARTGIHRIYIPPVTDGAQGA